MQPSVSNIAPVEDLLYEDSPSALVPNNPIHVAEPLATRVRPQVEGKFFYRGGKKFYVKGATYGTFSPNSNGEPFPEKDQVDLDFAEMAASDINAVRVYTVPPRWLLDLALSHSLLVLVGIPWEQHLAFTDDKEVQLRIEAACEQAARDCCAHPAVFGYSLGNEIKGNIVRWLGRQNVEKYIERLYSIVKRIDPDALVTYVNFPTTEYLDLSFLDFMSFNVYLESPEKLDAYLARLQSVAAEKPLLLAEVGMDSQRNGDVLQAQTLKWQIDSVFNSGCAGTFVYAWTDEWFTEGHAIEDWDFGLTTRDRRAKPALTIVKNSFNKAPFDDKLLWPKISVVVCSYNGSKTIAETINAIQKLDYPDFELIVIDDGSIDATASIAKDLGARVISTPNRGLSNARNTGWELATGDIIAYSDDDAYPDIHWLRYVAIMFRSNSVAATGGPNLAPKHDGLMADCVSGSPGSPMEVLLSDTRAEHIPGCNMSIRRSVLEELGGFDAQFRAAGDDVDLCWRILEKGYDIGFHAGAANWHHRRKTIKSYLSQQEGYGRAEAMLASKWPEKYNAMGHINWQGVIYGKGVTRSLSILKNRVYTGVWGSAPFQRMYNGNDSAVAGLFLMPECLLLLAVIAPFALLGTWVKALLPLLFLFSGLAAVLFIQAFLGGLRSTKKPNWQSLKSTKRYLYQLGLTSLMHLVQPAYRLKGRLTCGHTPFFKFNHSKAPKRIALKLLVSRFRGALWEGRNCSPTDRLNELQHNLEDRGLDVENGNDYSHWDMTVAVLPLGVAKLKLMVEEYGHEVELVRYRVLPSMTKASGYLLVISTILFALAVVGSLKTLAWIMGSLIFLEFTAIAVGAYFAICEIVWGLTHYGDTLREDSSD